MRVARMYPVSAAVIEDAKRNRELVRQLKLLLPVAEEMARNELSETIEALDTQRTLKLSMLD